MAVSRSNAKISVWKLPEIERVLAAPWFESLSPEYPLLLKLSRLETPQPFPKNAIEPPWEAQPAGLEKHWREMPAVYGLINDIR